MGKVRFSCPKCRAVMQTNDDKIGFDINCPQCKHRFTLVGQSSAQSNEPQSSTDFAAEQTRQWVDAAVEPRQPPASDANVARTRPSSPSISYAPAPNPPSAPNAIPPIYQGNASSSFSCPYCHSRQPPIWKSEVSTAGWITCVILAFTTCFFFWVGLLIRDKYTICSSCKARLPRPFL